MHVEFDPERDADISGLEWWEVLKALYDKTRPLGLGFIHARELSDELAMEMIGVYVATQMLRFDYLFGRPMKIGFHTQDGRSWVSRVDMYDRDSMAPARDTIADLRRRKAAERDGR
jgi:hypothetical protein